MDINNFGPFDSAVWGTVSDWTMVVVTFFTLLYLIKTFIAQNYSLGVQQQTLASQLSVQKDQNELTRIELERHRNEIKPILTGIPETLHPLVFSNNASFDVRNSSDFPAYNITITASNPKWIIRLPYEPLESLMPGRHFVAEFLIDTENEQSPEMLEGGLIHVNFSDKSGNKYVQYIAFYGSKHSNNSIKNVTGEIL